MIKKIKSVDIKLTTEELTQMLHMQLKSPHSKLIADIIIGNLAETEVGLKQLFMAMQGIFKPVEFTIGQSVLIKPEKLYDYRFNTQMMIDEGYFVNGLMPGLVKDVREHRDKRITFEYKYIDKDKSDKHTTYDEDVREEDLFDSSNDFI